MGRVATLVSNQILVDRMMSVRKRIDDTQVQLTTGKKSQDYAGISNNSLRLVSFENQSANLKRYVENNTTATLRLNIQQTQVSSMESVLTKLRQDLVTYTQSVLTRPTTVVNSTNFGTATFNNPANTIVASTANGLSGLSVGATFSVAGTLFNNTTFVVTATNGTTVSVSPAITAGDGAASATPVFSIPQPQTAATTSEIDAIQSNAFNAMKDIEFMLNTNVGGRYLFSGSKTDEKPVTFNFSNVTGFQAKYPGTGADYPVIRAQQVADTVLTAANNNFTSLDFGAGTAPIATGLTFDGVSSQIIGGADVFENVSIGSRFTVAGALVAGNNTTYTVTANDGTNLTVTPAPTTEAVNAAATARNPTDTITANQTPIGAATVPKGFGNLTFDANANTIKAATSGAFAPPVPVTDLTNWKFAVGSKFTVMDAVGGGPNKGITYTITRNDGTTLTVDPTPLAEALTATPTLYTKAFSPLPIGSTFAVTGSGVAGNNDTYTVTGNVGGQLTVAKAGAPAMAANTTAVATMTAAMPNNYYSGDQRLLAHRVDEDRTITLGINATEGAFEKTLRAMGIIVQGDLFNNPGRVQIAINLLGDALQHSSTFMPNESASALNDVQNTLGRNAVILKDTDQRHQDYMSFLDARSADMMNIDPLEAATKMQADSTALQIAMKAMAQISDLSLANYL